MKKSALVPLHTVRAGGRLGSRLFLRARPAEAVGWRCRGLGTAFHTQCQLVWTRGPKGAQEQLPDGSKRHRVLNGHCPVGRLAWQNAAICLPAPTNPLHSPDTHIQTIFPRNPQSRKASAFGLTPGMKPGLSGALLYAQESENRSCCQFLYALLFLFL